MSDAPSGPPRWGVAGAGQPCTVRGNGLVEVETCGGTWLFSVARSRFCRVPRGTTAEFLPPDAWRPFVRLVLSSDGRVRVVLDADAQTGISGWVHEPGCRRCGATDDVVAHAGVAG